MIDNAKGARTASTAGTVPGFQSILFRGLAPPETRAILAPTVEEKFAPRYVLQQEGQPATRLWVLVTGRVAAYRHADQGGKLFLGWGVPGDAFGLATILREEAAHLVTIEAIQGGSLLAWDQASIRSLISQYPNLNQTINAVATKYLSILINLLSARAFQNAQQRLARTLVEGARQLGRTEGKGIELELTNQQLADAAYVSLFTASRQLSDWQDRGLLEKRRGRIILRSFSDVEKLSDEI